MIKIIKLELVMNAQVKKIQEHIFPVKGVGATEKKTQRSVGFLSAIQLLQCLVRQLVLQPLVLMQVRSQRYFLLQGWTLQLA